MCVSTATYASNIEAGKIGSEGCGGTGHCCDRGSQPLGWALPLPPVQDPLHITELQQLALTFVSMQLVLMCLINRLWSDFKK